ncbi:MAG: hypothetical protein ACTHJ2_01175 [Candidatus Nitrosocosmicus sp.]
MHDMTRYEKSKIFNIIISIILAIGIASISGNMPAFEKTMAVCFDSPFCDTPHNTFSFGRLQTGHCTLQWANFYLLPGGVGYLEDYVTSTK